MIGARRATLAGGRVVEFWTAEVVIEHMAEAADVMTRLRVRGVWPAGYRSYWPDVMTEFHDEVGMDPKAIAKDAEERTKPAEPSSEEIDRMDTTIAMLSLVADPKRRRVVWARACGLSNRRIARHVHSNRETVGGLYRAAIAEIVAALNVE